MTEMEELTDFPKIQCPFIRQTFDVNKEDWKRIGNKFMLREPKAYLVVDQINPGYEWVFEDPDTFAVEKLNGTNVKLKTKNGRLVSLMNRKNVIDPLQIISGKTSIIESIFMSISKGYVEKDGEQAGESIGPKINGNNYHLNNHEWYPFNKAIKDLTYRSFHEHDRTFDNWSLWFKDWLISRYHTKRTPMAKDKKEVYPEGVVFYNLRRKSEGKSYMAKLRRDMFDWYYDGIEIYGYDKKGRDINAVSPD